MNNLAIRLGIIGWRREHPEIADVGIEHPIVIVGQPRTGTTILYDLLALDPSLRAPLTWEVDRPLPPPETATYDTDPRIAEVDETLAMADSLIPGFTSFHPMGATLAQECVRITAGDFRSMIFPIQFRLRTYNRWLLHDADLRPAYRWHRLFLQHLQSRHPAQQWLLKSPAHLWHLDELAGEYPDALVVQTHRDPLKVIASTSALATHLRRMASDEPDIVEIAADYADDIFLGLDRGIDARDRGVIPPERIVDVQFAAFVADPIATVRDIYAGTRPRARRSDRAADASVPRQEPRRRWWRRHPLSLRRHRTRLRRAAGTRGRVPGLLRRRVRTGRLTHTVSAVDAAVTC